MKMTLDILYCILGGTKWLQAYWSTMHMIIPVLGLGAHPESGNGRRPPILPSTVPLGKRLSVISSRGLS